MLTLLQLDSFPRSRRFACALEWTRWQQTTPYPRFTRVFNPVLTRIFAVGDVGPEFMLLPLLFELAMKTSPALAVTLHSYGLRKKQERVGVLVWRIP